MSVVGLSVGPPHRPVVCAGDRDSEAWIREPEAMGIPGAQRRKRMIENIGVPRHPWMTDGKPSERNFIEFEDKTLLPKQV
jgi:hypothetical protein